MTAAIHFRVRIDSAEVEVFEIVLPGSHLPAAEHNRLHDALAREIGSAICHEPRVSEARSPKAILHDDTSGNPPPGAPPSQVIPEGQGGKEERRESLPEVVLCLAENESVTGSLDISSLSSQYRFDLAALRHAAVDLGWVEMEESFRLEISTGRLRLRKDAAELRVTPTIAGKLMLMANTIEAYAMRAVEAVLDQGLDDVIGLLRRAQRISLLSVPEFGAGASQDINTREVPWK